MTDEVVVASAATKGARPPEGETDDAAAATAAIANARR